MDDKKAKPKPVKPKPPTRDELLRLNEGLERTLQSEKERNSSLAAGHDNKDITLRLRFSNVLGAPRFREYGQEKTSTYSWEEIFCEVGKLLADRRGEIFGQRLSELEQRVNAIEQRETGRLIPN